jgi:hypothetical protein
MDKQENISFYFRNLREMDSTLNAFKLTAKVLLSLEIMAKYSFMTKTRILKEISQKF